MEQHLGVFGEWDAPITDDLLPIPTPVGEMCVWCNEPVQEGDNGRRLVRPFITNEETEHRVLVEHRECSFRQVMGGIGHLVDHGRYCATELGPDAGLTKRQSALLVWKYFQVTHLDPTDSQAQWWRQKLEILRKVHSSAHRSHTTDK